MKYFTTILIIIFVFGTAYYFSNRNTNNTDTETEIMNPKNLSWVEPPTVQIDANKNYEAVINSFPDYTP